MTRIVRSLTSIVMLVVAATGCGSMGQGGQFSFWKQNVETFQARVLVRPEAFEEIDLALELDPSAVEVKADPTDLERLARLRRARDKFYENPVDQPARRNRLQERMLAASVQRCAQYKSFLKQLDAETNVVLGSLVTATAGAGAIVTGLGAARALAGAAAILSGVRAEFNEALFQRLTIQVITNAIDARRKETYGQILQRRNDATIAAYPVEAAIRDALEYHEHCSLIAGLEHAALAIERVENPGLLLAAKALHQARELQAIMNAPLPAVTPGTISPSRLTATGQAIGAKGPTTTPERPLDAYWARVQGVAQQAAELTRLVETLNATPDGQPLAANRSAVATLIELGAAQTREALTGHKARSRAAEEAIRAAEVELTKAAEPARTEKLAQLHRLVGEGSAVIAQLDAIYMQFSQPQAETQAALLKLNEAGLTSALRSARRILVIAIGHRQTMARDAVVAATDTTRVTALGTALGLAGTNASSKDEIVKELKRRADQAIAVVGSQPDAKAVEAATGWSDFLKGLAAVEKELGVDV